MTPIDDHLPPMPAQLEPPRHVTESIRQRIAADLQPKRGPSARTRWLLGLAGVVAAMFAVGMMAADQAASAPQRALAILLISIALIGVATFLGLARAGSVPVSVGTRTALALLPPLAFLLIFSLAHGVLPLETPSVAEMEPSTAGCLMRGALLAALPLAVLVLAWRRTDPFTPRLTGALIGGWAGLTGAVGLTVACPSTDIFHVAVGHGGALVGGALIGMWLGRRFLSP
jgi:hypothetical protein